MKKYSKQFLKLIEHLNLIRDRLIWLPLSSDDTEEALFSEICSYINEYKSNIKESR